MNFAESKDMEMQLLAHAINNDKDDDKDDTSKDSDESDI